MSAADLEHRIDARLLAERSDLLAASATVTEMLERAQDRYERMCAVERAAWCCYDRRKSSANEDAWNRAMTAVETAQSERLAFGARSRQLAAQLDRLADPGYRQRLIDRARVAREQRERAHQGARA